MVMEAVFDLCERDEAGITVASSKLEAKASSYKNPSIMGVILYLTGALHRKVNTKSRLCVNSFFDFLFHSH